MKIRATGKSDVGLKRKLNEDSYLIAPELGLYIVADGMGGHKAGEVASRMVVEAMADYWSKMRLNKPPSIIRPVQSNLPETAKHLINSIVLTNMIIHEAQKKPEYHRMGSTVSALLEDDDCLWLANVGDSPVYIFEHSRLILISQEHSVEAERRSMGLSLNDSFEGSTNPVLKNVLTRVLGLTEEVNVYINPLRPEAGDLIMMCSDGLTNYVSEQSIKAILDDFSVPHERKVDRLISEANQGGGGDNVSVLLLEVLEEGKWEKFKKKLMPKG